MTNKQSEVEVQQSRRSLIKRLGAGGAVATAALSTPKEWAKPLVDVVVLPAHAATSPVPYTLSVVNVVASPSATCSGNIFPPIPITGEFTLVGCSAARILSVTPSLPGGASLETSFAVGDSIATGEVFVLTVNNYPSNSPFACMATEPGSVTFEYDCVDFAGPSQSVSINLLEEILKGSA